MTPLTPRAVGELLAEIVSEIGKLTDELDIAERKAGRTKAEYDRAVAIAFRQSSGSVEARRHNCTEQCHGRRLAAEDAAAEVKKIKNKIAWHRDRIDVGRSYGAALRAEASAVGPWTEG